MWKGFKVMIWLGLTSGMKSGLMVHMAIMESLYQHLNIFVLKIKRKCYQAQGIISKLLLTWKLLGMMLMGNTSIV